MKKNLQIFFPLATLLSPLVAMAQNAGAIENIINKIINTLNNILIPLLFVLATLVFLWGVIKFIMKEDPKERNAAKGLMLWGIIGLAVMLGVWGIVQILTTYFGVGGPGIPTDVPSQ